MEPFPNTAEFLVKTKENNYDLFTVPMAVAIRSKTLYDIIEDSYINVPTESRIPIALPANVDADTFEKFIIYACATSTEDKIKELKGYNNFENPSFDPQQGVVRCLTDYKYGHSIEDNSVYRKCVSEKKIMECHAKIKLNVLDQDNPNQTQRMQNLIDLIILANYLDVPDLLDTIATEIANLIKGKTTEELRVLFNVPNDWAEGEEEAKRKELEDILGAIN